MTAAPGRLEQKPRELFPNFQAASGRRGIERVGGVHRSQVPLARERFCSLRAPLRFLVVFGLFFFPWEMKSLRDPDVLGLSKVCNPPRGSPHPGVLCQRLTRRWCGDGGGGLSPTAVGSGVEGSSAPRQTVPRGQRDAAGSLSHLRLPCPYRGAVGAPGSAPSPRLCPRYLGGGGEEIPLLREMGKLRHGGTLLALQCFRLSSCLALWPVMGYT